METNTFNTKTRSELIEELEDLRRRLTESEKAEVERWHAEAALRASEEKYRILLDESSDPIFTFSPHGQYRYVNREFANGLGKMPEEIIGRRIWDVFPQEEADKRFAIVKEVFENGGSRVIEVRVPRPNGDRYYITTVKPILDDDHRVTSVMCISKEITERRRAEEALRESEERMKSFFENVPVGIFISTRDGKFVYVNPAMPEIMGYDSCEEMMEVVNRSSIAEALYVDPLGRQTLIEELDRSRYHWLFYESRYRRKDGRIIDAAISIGEKHDTTAGESRFYGIVTDITERKRIEAELIAAKQAAENASLAKSRFLAAASHDLRQPIQAIGLFNNALVRTGLSKEQKRISDYLSQSAHSLGDLLGALLDISRLDAGVVKPSPEAIQVETLFNKIDADFSPLVLEKSLRFKLCFPFREMAIFTDVQLLASLLGNLIGNAIKYTEEGGILVGIRRRGNQAVIQVWDTGIGVAPEHMNNIFEEYFQVGNPERDRTKGLGLGLAITKRLANLLETEVVCRSRLGKGSVFEFRLPLAEESPTEKRSPIERETPDAGAVSGPGGRHIVVVEDDVMVSKAIELSLGSLGMRVTTYANAEDALANSEITDADFYISDFRLLGLNGVQFLDALQRRSAKPIKAAVLTGDTSPDRIEITQLSRWTVLFKPIDLSRLLSEIESQDPMH